MAAAAAGALLALGLDGHVADLAAGAKRTAHEPAAYDDATAHARAERDHHKAADALGRTLPELAEGSVGIIHEGKLRAGKGLLQGGAHAFGVQRDVGEEAHLARIVHGAGHVEPHGDHI